MDIQSGARIIEPDVQAARALIPHRSDVLCTRDRRAVLNFDSFQQTPCNFPARLANLRERFSLGHSFGNILELVRF
eukprot:1837539-Pyramimonas_sp.AAC.1